MLRPRHQQPLAVANARSSSATEELSPSSRHSSDFPSARGHRPQVPAVSPRLVGTCLELGSQSRWEQGPQHLKMLRC